MAPRKRNAADSAASASEKAGQAAGDAAGQAAGATADAGQAAGRAASDTAQTAAGEFGAGIEATVQRIRDLNERVIADARTAGEASLDAYEQALQSFVDVEKQLAGATQLDWVQAVVRTQADFVQKMSEVYVSAIRGALR